LPLLTETGKYILSDAASLETTGFDKLVKVKWGKSGLGNVKKVRHTSVWYLHHLKKRGANVVLQTLPWSVEKLKTTIKRAPHKFAKEHSSATRYSTLSRKDS
jgi:hypothetical protein